MAVIKGWSLDRAGRYADFDCRPRLSHCLHGMSTTERAHGGNDGSVLYVLSLKVKTLLS